MNQTKQRENVSIVDLVHPSWFKQTEGSSVWVTAYRVCRLEKKDLKSEVKIINLNQTRAIIMYGVLNYLDTSQVRIKNIISNDGKIKKPKIRMSQTPEDVYLLLIIPFDVDGRKGDEALAKKRVSVATGLIAAFNGRNMVFEHIYDNIIGINKGLTSFGPVEEEPMWFVKPDISDSRFQTICDASKKITKLDEPSKKRIELSLRWLGSAIYDGGVDAYLKYWFALETLGMPNSTNIRQLNESLSKAYKLSYKEVKNRFVVGKLFGLRSRIVHEGQITPINARLLKYMETLYTDILCEHLELECELRAGNILDDPMFKLHEYLGLKKN